jgi:hypothetical protein
MIFRSQWERSNGDPIPIQLVLAFHMGTVVNLESRPEFLCEKQFHRSAEERVLIVIVTAEMSAGKSKRQGVD